MATSTSFALASSPSGNISIFQPPHSPASSALTAVHEPPRDYFSPRLHKRPRANVHAREPQLLTPRTASPSWTQCATPGDPFWHNSAPVNEQYKLAGGYDTPGLVAAELESSGMYAQEDCRRRVRDADRPRSETVPLSGPLARERNGMPRLPSSPNGSPQTNPGWTSFAFSLVGKVFNFGSNVFSGFYAGGGKGYDLKQPRSPIVRTYSDEDCSTPVPGSWQDDDYDEDPIAFSAHSSALEQQGRDASSRVQPNKRRHTDRESWVLIGTPDADVTASSPKRKPSYTGTLRSRPPAWRATTANGRKSLTPLSRRQSSQAIPYHGAVANSIAPSQLERPVLDRRASFAPTRSPHSPRGRPSSSGSNGKSDARRSSYGQGLSAASLPLDTTPKQNSQLSPEATRYVRRQARADKAADRAMNSMSRRLEDLIRQGQEALGTQVSVEERATRSDTYDYDDDREVCGDDEDEGFVDEDVEGWQ